jgi:membrane-bound lytic murein transglycosylase D
MTWLTLSLMLPLAAAVPVGALEPTKPGQDPVSASDAEASEELEALRALEELAVEPEVDDAVLRQWVRHLGPAHPLRTRVEDALSADDLREDAPFELGRIADVLAFDVAQVADRFDIPVEMQPLVAQYIQFFQGPGRRWFRRWVERSTRFIPVMHPILEQHGVPRDTVYLAMIESGFSPQAYSWAHAAGPWQFIEATGRQFGLRLDFWVDERRDPIKSTHAAARFLKQLHGSLGHWYLAWAGYNTGPGRVRRLTEKRGTTDFWELSEGRGLAKETRHYVPKLIAAALVAKHPAAFGFDPSEFEFQTPWEWDEAHLVGAVDLAVLARAAGTTEDVLRELNPELRRWSTPPASEQQPYLLRLPRGSAASFVENLEKVPLEDRFKFAGHLVQRGDTLWQLAVKYETPVEGILRMNNLKSAHALRVGQLLMIPVPGGGAHLLPAGVTRASSRPGPAPTPDRSGRAKIRYKIRSGDTLWGIAERHGVSVEDLRRWNGLRRNRPLQIDQVLSIWQPRKPDASR